MINELDPETINKILVHLDGWALSSDDENIEFNTDELSEEEVNLLFDNKNKKISLLEIELIYESSLNYAQNYTKRLLNTFDDVNKELFLNAVYVLTASNLFGKFNLKVNNKQEEDVTPQSRAGVLFSQAIKQLDNHKISTVKTRKTING